MSTNGQLVFTDVDKITFKGVGNASNAVIDTLTGKIGVGVDSPDANLHVVGNSYVSTNLELGGTLIMGTVNVEAQHSLEAVTATGNITPLTIEFTNPTTSLVASGNVVVTGNVTADHFVGDGSNITGISSTLQAITDSGNVTSNTVQFSNATTGFVTTANVEVGGELTVSNILAKTTLLAHSQQKVVSSDRGSQDNFGKSVSISGDGNFAVVGAHQEDEDVSGSSTLSNAGAAYIYKYNGSTWSQVQKIVASDRAVNTQFGWSVSISNDGNSIVIGAVAESMDASGSNQISAAGAAYIFTYNGSAWVQIQKVVASDRATYDFFGKSVSISGDGNTFAVGADAEDEDESGANTLSGSGSVYIFTRDTANVLTSTWSQQKKLVATDRSAGAYFGSSLSVSSDGQTILVGAYGESEDVSGANTLTLAGAAYIFTYSGSTWTQKQKIVASNRIGDGYFGWGVSISKDGNVALIGEAGITGTGAAYTFTRDTLNDLTSSWTFQQKLVSNDITSGDVFGKNVSLSNDGNVAIISASGNGTDESGGNNISNAGAAYIFSRNGTTWSQIKKIVASDRTSSDNLSSSSGEGTGVSISSNGNKAIVGAALQDTDESGANNLTNAGAAYIFLNLASSQSNLNIDGNVVVTGNVTAGYLYGDGSNISGISSNLDQIVNIGNVTSNTVQFTNATTSLVASGNVEVGTANLFVDTVNSRVGIGTNALGAKLHVHENTLGTTAGNSTDIVKFGGDSGGPGALLLTSERVSNGSTWTTTGLRLQKIVDSTKMGYIQFGEDGDLTGQLIFGNSDATERMRITPAGFVGIGTTSPAYQLDVQGSTDYDGSTTVRILNPASSYGRTQLHIVGRYQSSNDAWSAQGARNAIMFKSQSSQNSAITNRWTIQSWPNGNNNDLGFMAGTNDTPKVVFRGSNGNVGIDKEAPTTKLHVNGDVFLENSVLWMGSTIFTGGNGLLQLTSSSTSYYHDAIACKPVVDGNWIIGFRNTSGSARGQIKGVSSTQVVYETSSDERLKKQIKPMESVLERVNNLKACTYTWIRDEMEGYGFIAQDVYKLFPEMKTSLPSTVWNPTCDDEYDYPRNEDGTDHYYGLDYGTFTPFLTKAIQELDEKVEERHNRKSFITDIDYLVIEDYEGLIVSANTNEFKNGKPTLTLSKVEKDKRCYGIILGKTKSIDSETIVQRSGDGRMWVINTQGNLESGDLITSSAVSGYGSKQDNDLLRSCTVAKITQDCDFTQKYIPIKCVKREMKDVTYYIQDYYVEVRHFDPYKKEDLLKRDVPMYFKPCEASSSRRGYERVITPFMTQDDYDNLSDEEKENYTVSHVIYKTPYEYEHLNEDDKSEYTETIKTGYYLKEVRESAKPMPECCGEYVTEVRQELVNVLDTNGQIQWEDHPTETEKAYKIRYLDASGVETDEASAVHKAAFVGCTYHCG